MVKKVRNRGRKRGVITIFYAILMPAVFAFLLGLFDLSRVYAARNLVYMSGSNAIDAALAKYDNDLFERYGLLAYTNDGMEEEVREIYMKNIDPTYGGGTGNKFDIYKLNTSADRLTVLAKDPLFFQNDVIRRQMIRDMKFLALENLARGVIDKFTKGEEGKQQTEIAEDMKAIEEQLGKIAKDMEKIRRGEEAIYGLMASYGVNSHNIDSMPIVTEGDVKDKLKGDNVKAAYSYIKEYNGNNDLPRDYENLLNNRFERIFNSYFTALVVKAHNMQVGDDEKDHNEKEADYVRLMGEYEIKLGEYEIEKGKYDNLSEEEKKKVKEPKKPSEPAKVPPLNDYEKTKYDNTVTFAEKTANEELEALDKDLGKLLGILDKGKKAIEDNKEKMGNISNELKNLEKKLNEYTPGPATEDDNPAEMKERMLERVKEYLIMLDIDRINEIETKCGLAKEAINQYRALFKAGIKNKYNELKKADDLKNIVNVNSRKRIHELLKDNSENINGIAKDNTIKEVPTATAEIKVLREYFNNSFLKTEAVTENKEGKKFTFDIKVQLKVPEKVADKKYEGFLDSLEALIDELKDGGLTEIKNELKKSEKTLSREGLPSVSAAAEQELSEAQKRLASEMVDPSAKTENFSVMDKLYLIEYIMSNFKRMVDVKTGPIPEETKEKTTLEYEVESILFYGGAKKEFNDKNVVDKMANFLLAERIAFNFAGFFMDFSRVDLIKNISIILSAGFLPVQIAIMAALTTAWVTYESILDVEDLLRGYNVPLIKKDWVFTFTMTAEDFKFIDKIDKNVYEIRKAGESNNKQNNLNLNYDDYLRLNMLAFGSEEGLINGTKDIVVHNIKTYHNGNFDFKNKYSSVAISASAGMGMLFNMSKVFDGGAYSQNINFKELKIEKGYD